MTRSRTWWFTTIAALVLVAGCGVEGSEGASDGGSSTEAVTSTTEALAGADQAALDTMVEAYLSLGFSQEEADCLGRAMLDLDSTADPDPSQLMDVINQCDIDAGRLGEIEDSIGDGSTEGVMAEALAAGLRAAGLTEEQASCVADQAIESFGPMGETPDLSELEPLFDDCGVDFSGGN